MYDAVDWAASLGKLLQCLRITQITNEKTVSIAF